MNRLIHVKTSAIALCVLLGGFALSGFSCADAQRIALNVAATGPRTCADLQIITGDLAAFANQVAATNASNARVKFIVGKVNNGVPLVNTDCTALAALAPSVAAGATLGVTVGSQFK